MLFQGKAFELSVDNNKIANLKINLVDQAANVFNAQALSDLKECFNLIKKNKEIKGLLYTSGKDEFIFGADVTEFLSHFQKSVQEMQEWLWGVNQIFNGFEDLEIPTVCAMNGFALGGGFEFCLTAAYRVASTKAKMGLPETQLGIIPGWGGTVRLSRLVGADNAIEWICGGKHNNADAALKIGAVDAVCEPDKLQKVAYDLLTDCINGKVDWKKKQVEKRSPLLLDKIEATMSFETGKAFVFGVAGPNYPAPIQAIECMQKGATLNRDEALKIEGEIFAKLTKTPVAESLVRVFLGDQYLKKVSKKVTKNASDVNHAAVLGAGIMGGGVAYQSASKGTPILMKDINHQALELGMNEAGKLLGKLVSRGKMDTDTMAKVIAGITPTLSYGDFESVNIVVEAVVENEKIKESVLSELETKVKPGTILTSNTSTISISKLAKALKKPEDFCGMHFFNPVHRMPLVEVIRGEKSSEKAIATTVAYALKMGKTPIVVNDCPGFLVNRILFPYFGGFNKLINDGADFQKVDKVMEKFGWPMGPAYLLDVVGIDTAHHAAVIIGEGFPDRMKEEKRTALDVMYEAKRYGQKNSLGFYEYELDRRGRPKKKVNPDVYNMIKAVAPQTKDISDEEIIDRMMIPMIFESIRCLEDNIVPSPVEVDMGLLLGLGFPPFRTGALKYADSIGLKELVEKAKKYESLGNLYKAPKMLLEMAESGKTFYQF